MAPLLWFPEMLAPATEVLAIDSVLQRSGASGRLAGLAGAGRGRRPRFAVDWAAPLSVPVPTRDVTARARAHGLRSRTWRGATFSSRW